MDIVSGITGAIEGVKALKVIKDLSDSNTVELRIAEVVDSLKDAQISVLELLQTNIQLIDENRRLSEELRAIKASNQERADYEKIKIGEMGATVYQQKTTKEVVCPLCFERGITRSLQHSYYKLTCNECSKEYRIKPVSIGAVPRRF